MGTFKHLIIGVAATALGTEAGLTQALDDTQLRARDQYIVGKPVRIDPVENLTEEQRQLTLPPQGYGVPGELSEQYRMMLHTPELLKPFRGIGSYFLVHGKMSVRDRELVVLRVGWLTQAPYEWGEHVAIGKNRAKLTSEEIARVKLGSGAPGWTEHESALLKAVEELFDDAMITDATWNVLAKSLSREELIELPILIGQYQTTAYILNSWRVRLRPSNPGMTAK